MDYWHKIVERYDASESNGSRSKDHGTFSQKISVILLIYLAFGTDYSSGIAEYFNELSDCEQPEKICPGVSKIPSKISSVLKQMEKDKLLTLAKKVSVRAGARSYYELNPQIIQSPSSDSPYLKCDGSPFMIPTETIAGFLDWLALKQAGTIDKGKQKQLDDQVRRERHERADGIFEQLFRSEKVDYLKFLFFIEAEAKEWDSQRRASNKQSALSSSVSDYIREMDNIHRDEILREWESCVDVEGTSSNVR
ncbi:MAG: hypothetical protein ABR985_07385 [Methanotrichaceae archaeon]|jgi:hypothetical protein